MKPAANFAALLQGYFTNRMIQQRNASPNTIASYRDTFRLLLSFAQQSLEKDPASLQLQDLQAPFIDRFLTHLEQARHIRAQSRNTRLAAIRSFFRYVALREPTVSALAQQVLAIPNKRYVTKPVAFLTSSEIDAILATADQATWRGRRDYALLFLATQTGLRVSELTSLCCQDLVLGTGAHVRCLGKGRRERCTPLRQQAGKVLKAWVRERHGGPTDPLFPTAQGHALSRDAVADLLAKYVRKAQLSCPSLKQKRVSPHVLRHSVAMSLLAHGVDRSVIALWLGHASMETTEIYLHASLELKEAALAKTETCNGKLRRFKPSDQLLAFLNGL